MDRVAAEVTRGVEAGRPSRYRRTNSRPQPDQWRSQVAVILTLIAFTALVCLIFWPGDMDFDTSAELQDARSGAITDLHSPTLEAVWRLGIHAGLRSPGWVLAGQVFTFLVGIYLLLRIRLTRPWAVAGAAGIFAFPSILGFGVHLGLDTWFTALLLCAFGLLARTARSTGRVRMAFLVAAVGCAFLASSARHNTVPAIAGFGFAAAAVTLRLRWQGWRRRAVMAVSSLALVAIFLGVQTTVERGLIRPTVVNPVSQTYYYDLIALSKREGHVLLPASVYPSQSLTYLSQWTTAADTSQVFWGSHAVIPWIVSGTQFASLQSAWFAAIRQHPFGYAYERAVFAANQLALVGRIPYTYKDQAALQPTDSPFRRAAHPELRAAATAYLGVGSPRQAGLGVGGPLQAAWVYLLVLFVGSVWYLRRRDLAERIVGWLGAGLLLYVVGVLVAAPVPLYRYVYPAVVGGAVLGVLLAVDAGRHQVRAKRSPRAHDRRQGARLNPVTEVLPPHEDAKS